MARKWTPADTVVATSAILLIVVFAVFGGLVWQGYHDSLRRTAESAETAANIVSVEVNWALRAARLYLRQISPEDVASGAQTVRDTLALLPAAMQLHVYGSDGRGLIEGDTSDGAEAAAAVGDIDWAVYPAPEDGAQGFVIAQRLPKVPGAIATLLVSPNFLEDFWASQRLGDDSTVSVVRAADGEVIVRYPPLTAPTNLKALPAYAALMEAEAGSYASARSPVDGVARVVGFKHLTELGLIALASVSQDRVLADLWEATITVLLLMGPISVASLAGALLAAHLLRQGERTRARLSSSLYRNEVLLREIHHRIKNNLQSVSSLLAMQPIPREVKAEMGLRLKAMAAVHEHAYRSNDFERVAVAEYLRTLIENIRQGQARTIRLEEDIEDLMVDRDVASPLGLIINEVASNAFKHAFTDGEDGVLSITLKRSGPKEGHLTIRDNGPGFDVDLPATGIGRRLIAALSEQIGGTYRYTREDGMRFDLTFPVEDAESAGGEGQPKAS
jgi:two-component sensor histidine kinase